MSLISNYRCCIGSKCLLNSLVQTSSDLVNMDASQGLTKIRGLLLISGLGGWFVLCFIGLRSTSTPQSHMTHFGHMTCKPLFQHCYSTPWSRHLASMFFSPSCCYCILSLAHHRRGLFLGLSNSDQLVEPRLSWFSHITSTHGRTFSPPLPSTAQ